jgi:hypothetical protein
MAGTQPVASPLPAAKPLPANFAPVAAAALRALSGASRLAGRAAWQAALAPADVRSEVVQSLGALLARGSSSGPGAPPAAVLDESLLLLGLFCLRNPGGRAALRWGPPPTLLQRAAALPLPFFAPGSRGAAALFPALLAAITGDAHNAQLLRADVALPTLRAFLQDEMQRPTPTPPLQRFALRARFPPEEWPDALAQLDAAEAEQPSTAGWR